MSTNNLDEVPFFSFKLDLSPSFQFPNLNIDSKNSEHLTPNVNFNSSDVFVKSNPQFNFGFESLNALTPKGKPEDSGGFNFNSSLPPLASNTDGTNFAFNGLDFTGGSIDPTISFRKTLAENPLVNKSATNILENGFIATDKNSKSTIKETIDLLKKNNTGYDYGKARTEAYAPTNITNPNEADYKTALLDHHLMKELLSGVVFKGSNDFTKDLGEKYANDLNILNTNEVGARERYIAVTKALEQKLELTGDDPLSLITKDIITKMGKVTVQERDKNGEVIKVEGKTRDITITAENFERYLDDPALQKAIQTEIDKRFHYQNNNYGTVIDNYRAKHPEIAPEKVKSEKGQASLSKGTKDKLTSLNTQIQKLRKTGNSNSKLGDILIGSASDKTITAGDRQERKGWGDYKEINWGESDHGSIFSTENKALIEELYSENIKKGENVKHLDQFTALMVKLLEKGANGTITNQEVDFLKKITIESDWQPRGASSQKIATEIINTIKDGSDFWK